MENSFKYFENRECKYYPCHEGIQQINCLFCYCPLYAFEKCPGECRYIDINGKKIKDCMQCTFPHEPENYDAIIKLLSSN